jgi:hypothetical protein
MFRKSEERRCPVSLASVYSNVAYCVYSIAEAVCSPSPFKGFDGEKRVQYTIQILAEQRERLRKRLTEKVRKVSLVRIPFVQRIQSIFH